MGIVHSFIRHFGYAYILYESLSPLIFKKITTDVISQ